MKDTNGGSVPVPDPTFLTTEALRREIEALSHRLERQLLAQQELTDEKIDRLKAVIDERFDSVKDKLALGERQRVEQKSDTEKAIQAALCVTADTPILCADLVWRPAGDLLVGDELIAVEEFVPQGYGQGRRFKRATVTANSLSRDALLRVNTPAGSVRCNYDHPWLSRRRRGAAWTWVKTVALKPGDQILRLFDPWEVDRSWEAGWLAGILDGEGSLTFQSRKDGGPRLGIGQVAGPVADQIDDALKRRVETIYRHVRPPYVYNSGGYSGNAQAQQRWQIDGRADIMKLLGSVRPTRFLVDSDRIWEDALIRSKTHGATEVTSVEGAGSGMVANLTTSTGTFIAGGFVAHNTAQKEAVAAQALAFGESVAKAETSTAKQLDQMQTTFKTEISNIATNQNDLKERVGKIEFIKLGVQEQRTEGRSSTAGIYAAIGIGITIILAVLSVIAFANP